MAKATTVTVEDSYLPKSVLIVQRPLNMGLAYKLRHRLLDAWAGYRDRKTLSAMLRQSRELAFTPWMCEVNQCLASAIDMERRDNHAALQSSLLRDAKARVTRYRVLEQQLTELKAKVNQADAETFDDQPITAGESLETPQFRLQRRAHEHALKVGAATASMNRVKAEMEQIKVDLERLKVESAVHDNAFISRSMALFDYSSRRMANYVRHGLRKQTNDGQPPIVPTLTLPDLSPQPFPKLDDD